MVVRFLIVSYVGICIGYMSYAQDLSPVPSHETQIIMLEIVENTIYSLDSNGLLLITNTTSLDTRYLHISKTPVAQAYFFFPYIVLIDTDTRMSVYNLQYKLITFQDILHSTNKGSVAFSSDLSLFAYNGNGHINIYHTQAWNKITSIENKNSSSIFLIISKNNRNIMNYNDNGTITYYDINSGEIIKSLTTHTPLQSLSLNSTLRYGVGYVAHTLQSIDVLDGSLVDSVLFSDTLVHVFPATPTDAAGSKIFYVLTLQRDGTHIIQMYEFTQDGLLQQKDLQSVPLVKPATHITGTEDYVYIGFEDGDVWRYSASQQFANYEVVSDNTTLAIYDVLLAESALLLATAEGIASVSLSAENDITTNDIRILHTQQFTNPAFISSHTPLDQSPSYYLFTSGTPYNYTLPSLFFDTLVNDDNNRIRKTQTSNTPIATLPSLLYTLSSTFQPIEPQPLPPTTRSLLKYDAMTISYSSHESVLYTEHAQGTRSIPVYAEHFVYKLLPGQDAETFMLWTNSPLLDTQRDALVTDNILYQYALHSDSTLTPVSHYFEIPFNHSMLDFQIIDPTSSTLLITTYDKTNAHSYVNLITFDKQPQPTPDSDNNTTIKKVLFPTSITPLTEITDETILKIVPLEKSVLLFTNESVHMIILDDDVQAVLSEQKVYFPEEFGLFRTANIAPMRTLFDNYTTENRDEPTYLITMVDQNNIVSLLRADTTRGLTMEFSFQVSKEYDILRY